MEYLYAAVGALISGVLYLGMRRVRVFIDWANGGGNPPREQVVVYLPLSMVLGAVVGYLIYEPVQAALTCYEQARPLVQCLMP